MASDRSSIFEVQIRPNYETHTLNLSKPKQTEQVVRDLGAGRDASIFGQFADPYVFDFGELGKVYGDADTLEDLGIAAELVSGRRDLDDDERREIWKAVLSSSEDDGMFEEVALDLLEAYDEED